MAISETAARKERLRQERDKRDGITRPGDKLFDVTCVIGSVVFDPENGVDPYLAAFEMIARYDNPGTFVFPSSDGGTTSVTVEFNPPPGGYSFDKNESPISSPA